MTQEQTALMIAELRLLRAEMDDMRRLLRRVAPAALGTPHLEAAMAITHNTISRPGLAAKTPAPSTELLSLIRLIAADTTAIKAQGAAVAVHTHVLKKTAQGFTDGGASIFGSLAS
jgi:hypothetical protein